jgi:uncharacterized RDD family membrane protein YckC
MVCAYQRGEEEVWGPDLVAFILRVSYPWILCLPICLFSILFNDAISVGYRSGGPGSIPGTNRKKVVGLERGPLSLVSTAEELLDRQVAAPV